jgi:large subunit ribosomal protein L10
MDRTSKQQVIEELSEKFERAKSLVFTEYKGLTVKEANMLRRECRNAGLDYMVAKNTLIYLALPESIRGNAKEHLAGTTAVAIDYSEGVTAAKTLVKFAKDHPAIKPKSGVLENRVLTAAQVDALAKLPSKDELLAKILGSVEAPARNVLGCFNGVATKLAGLFKAYQDKLQAAA